MACVSTLSFPVFSSVASLGVKEFNTSLLGQSLRNGGRCSGRVLATKSDNSPLDVNKKRITTGIIRHRPSVSLAVPNRKQVNQQ